MLNTKLQSLFCGLVAAALTGCASTKGVELPVGTLLLGEVSHAVTKASLQADEIAPGVKAPGWGRVMAENGYTAELIDQGRVIMVRDFIYWNNTVSGIKRSHWSPTQLPEGMSVQPGQVVEMVRTERPPSRVSRVRAASLAAGACYYGDISPGAVKQIMGAVSRVGPSGLASLYCAGIEKEGWQRPRTFWHKLPGGEPAQETLPPQEVSLSEEPAPKVVVDGMATLTLLSPNAPFGALVQLPFWVDGVKVASMEAHQCDVLLLAPGSYQVTAGTGTVMGMGWPKRELNVEVTAGNEVVVEYVMDEAAYRGMGLGDFLNPEDWLKRSFQMVLRAPTPRDGCALRHEPLKLMPKSTAD